jgi:hypothetical protein
VVGAEQGVGEEPRDGQVAGVDRGQVVDQGVAEVGVGAVGLVGELAQLDVAVALGRRRGVDQRHGRLRGLALGGAVAELLRQLAVGALDDALDQLAVQGAVDDDRPAALELDQHAGGAGLVDVALGEADLRRAVGIAVDLPVELVGVGAEPVGPLAQAQLADLAGADAVEVRGEDLVIAVGQRGVQDPAGLAREPFGRPGVAVVEIGTHGVEQGGRHGADRAELVDGG